MRGVPVPRMARFGGPADCVSGLRFSLTIDQRYMTRDAQCDLGAFEFADFTTVTITIDPTSLVKQSGWAVVTGTVTCSRAESFAVGVELHQSQRVAGEVVVR